MTQLLQRLQGTKVVTPIVFYDRSLLRYRSSPINHHTGPHKTASGSHLSFLSVSLRHVLETICLFSNYPKIFICQLKYQKLGSVGPDSDDKPRGVTPIGAVSRAATGVKMQSNGQGTFWGSVKRSSGVLGPISSIARWPRGVAEILRMRKFAVVKRSRPFLDGQKS